MTVLGKKLAPNEPAGNDAQRWRIVALAALSGDEIASISLYSSASIAELQKAIAESAGEQKPIRLVFDGRQLQVIDSLKDAGLMHGSIISVFRDGLPGWTRICHGDENAKQTDGSSWVWDLQNDEMRALAQKATRVRIRDRRDPDRVIESRVGAYPIQEVRIGLPFGLMHFLRETKVEKYWEVPEGCDLEPLDSANFWHASFRWRHRRGHSVHESTIYSCYNGGGIHWNSKCCGWMCEGSTDFELYINAEPHIKVSAGSAEAHGPTS